MHSAVVTPPRMDPAYEVEQQLQGTWVQVSGRWNCRVFFAGHHFAIRFQNGEVYMGVYNIDLSQSPPAMDMTLEQGPDHYCGLTALCIYELDGHTLRWCANEPGVEQRHTRFPADGESKFPTLVFRRDGM
jgi:uncharacterized protein (TIGR03067 family)